MGESAGTVPNSWGKLHEIRRCCANYVREALIDPTKIQALTAKLAQRIELPGDPLERVQAFACVVASVTTVLERLPRPAGVDRDKIVASATRPFCVWLGGCGHVVTKNGEIDPRVQFALRSIEMAPDGRLPRFAFVASQLNISRSHLSHLIKEQTRRPFSSHVRRVRMAKARCLLSDNRLSIKEVAYALSYKTTSQFDRDFKATHGCRPTEWREHAGACDARKGGAIEIAGAKSDPIAKSKMQGQGLRQFQSPLPQTR